MSDRDIIILGCSSQQPTRYRNHGAYLVRWNTEGLLFDPGEGTQRQFIFAEVAPTVVTRIFVSHFHGDHCLGLGSMLMRLNLDKVPHPVHCYYPASCKKNFDYLRYGCIYHQNIEIVEHPVAKAGVVHDDGKFKIEADFLEHGVENLAWRVTEPDKLRFNKEALEKKNIRGLLVKELIKNGFVDLSGERILLTDVSFIQDGDVFAYVSDTRPCKEALSMAKKASVLISESTYTETHRDLAREYHHMTAKEAALLAKEAGVNLLILTHFSARYQNSNEFLAEAKAYFPNVQIAEDFKRILFP